MYIETRGPHAFTLTLEHAYTCLKNGEEKMGGL